MVKWFMEVLLINICMETSKETSQDEKEDLVIPQNKSPQNKSFRVFAVLFNIDDEKEEIILDANIVKDLDKFASSNLYNSEGILSSNTMLQEKVKSYCKTDDEIRSLTENVRKKLEDSINKNLLDILVNQEDLLKKIFTELVKDENNRKKAEEDDTPYKLSFPYNQESFISLEKQKESNEYEYLCSYYIEVKFGFDKDEEYQNNSKSNERDD